MIRKHPDYLKQLAKWQKVKHCFDRDVITFAHNYIIPPAGMFLDTIIDETAKKAIETSIQGLSHRIAEGSGWNVLAKKYANDGVVPELVGSTARGNMSLITEYAPVIELVSKLNYLNESATKDGVSLTQLFFDTILDVQLSGRVPLLIDIVGNKLKIVKYSALALLNWQARGVNDDARFSWAIFQDYKENPKYDPIEAPEEAQYIPIYIKHYLKDTVYTVDHYEENEGKLKKIKSIIPKYFGKTLDFIPLVCIGSLDNTPDVDLIPLEGIANCEIESYRLSCLLAHAETASSVPSFYMTGVDEDEVPPVTGAGVTIACENEQARIGYTKTDTSAMTHILERMDAQYAQAQELGANLLGSRKNSSESGEALRLRQASTTASLKSIVKNCGEGFNILLRMMTKWMGISEVVSFEPNKEFSTFALTANETVALVQSWQAGAIAKTTLLNNFRKAGMLIPGDSVEDELKRQEKPEEHYVPVDCKNPNVPGLDVGENLPKSNTMNKNL